VIEADGVPTARSTAAVVFDLGGVLLDWDPRYLYRRLLPDEPAVEWFLSEICTPEWNREQDRGRPWAEAVAELSARFPEHAALIAAYHERWDETLAGAITPSVEVLARLRERGVRCYALTNFSVEMLQRTRARFDFLDWFDGMVVSGEVGLVKPDPRIFRLAVERFGLDPTATVYIDDQPANVAAARELGMVAIHFTEPERMRAALRGLLDGPTRPYRASEHTRCVKLRYSRTDLARSRLRCGPCAESWATSAAGRRWTSCWPGCAGWSTADTTRPGSRWWTAPGWWPANARESWRTWSGRSPSWPRAVRTPIWLPVPPASGTPGGPLTAGRLTATLTRTVLRTAGWR